MAEMDRQRGARIRQLRDDLPLSREAFANKLGVSVKTAYNWEKGHEINPENLRALAKFFNVTVDYIRMGDTPDLLGVKDSEDQWIVVGKLDEIIARLDRLEQFILPDVEVEAGDDLPPVELPGGEDLPQADSNGAGLQKDAEGPSRRAG